jgi:hypothetical protein
VLGDLSWREGLDGFKVDRHVDIAADELLDVVLEQSERVMGVGKLRGTLSATVDVHICDLSDGLDADVADLKGRGAG